MNNFDYAVKLTPDKEGGYVVTCRDLPEVITQGETIDEALSEARDALDEALALRIDDGLEIPTPSQSLADEYLAAPPVETQIKVFLHLALRESNLSKSELARRLNVDEKSIRRLLDPHYAAKLPRVAEAMRVLGKRLVIGMQ